MTALTVAAAILSACSGSPADPGDPGSPDSSGGDTTLVSVCPDTSTTVLPLRWTYRVVAEYPHDPSAFTQGLVIRNGELYEGTGLRGQSTLRQVALETGAVLRSTPLDSRFFGEGVTVLGDRVFQLTWQAHRGLVYNRTDFTPLEQFEYQGQGWGLTDDGEELIMSDGSSTLRFLDPVTFEVLRTVSVYDNTAGGNQRRIANLNELEYIDGEVYANVWQGAFVARICPDTGVVLGWIDFRGPLDRTECPGMDVLNGIAYDKEQDRLFVTGKRWCTLFEVELILQETEAGAPGDR